jgi:hypothetical protein
MQALQAVGDTPPGRVVGSLHHKGVPFTRPCKKHGGWSGADLLRRRTEPQLAARKAGWLSGL